MPKAWVSRAAGDGRAAEQQEDDEQPGADRDAGDLARAGASGVAGLRSPAERGGHGAAEGEHADDADRDELPEVCVEDVERRPGGARRRDREDDGGSQDHEVGQPHPEGGHHEDGEPDDRGGVRHPARPEPGFSAGEQRCGGAAGGVGGAGGDLEVQLVEQEWDEGEPGDESGGGEQRGAGRVMGDGVGGALLRRLVLGFVPPLLGAGSFLLFGGVVLRRRPESRPLTSRRPIPGATPRLPGTSRRSPRASPRPSSRRPGLRSRRRRRPSAVVVATVVRAVRRVAGGLVRGFVGEPVGVVPLGVPAPLLGVRVRFSRRHSIRP